MTPAATSRLAAASASLAILAMAAACSPKTETAKAPETPAAAPAASQAPDVAAAAAAGTGDPRIPTVDPATINEKSTTADVMHAYVIPGSETLFAAESEDPPKDDAGWAKLQAATDSIIKGAELLKADSRSEGRAGWVKDADTVITATKVTAAALAKKNADDLVFQDGDMMTGCTACHQHFRDLNPPKGKLADDAQKPAKPN